MSIDNLPASQVKGVALIAIREYIESTLDLRTAGEFFKPLPSDLTYNVLHADKNKWYPFTIQSALHQHIVKWFNHSQPRKVIEDLGHFVAQYEIETSLKALLGVFPLKLILNRAQVIWSKFYQPGVFCVRSSHDGGAVFELAGFQTDPYFCVMVESWLRVAGEKLKLTNVQITETACMHKGAGRCRWEATWDPKQK